jgi:arsenate reductase-like glutaredoxin family protein
VEYIDVLSDAGKLDTMLKYSDGRRKVPIIVDRGEVTIGFNGKA